jgi:hypothetical protein
MQRCFTDNIMPYALILIGAVMLVSAVRNTHTELWGLVKEDFTEKGGFLTWVAAIAVVGGMGYVPKLKPLSIAFMTLLLVVLVLSNGGVFAKLESFIKSGAAPAPGSAVKDATNKITGAAEKVARTSLEVITENLSKGFT